MSTAPHKDIASIISDGRGVLARAREDQRNPEFASRLTPHELDHFESSVDELARAEGKASSTLHAQVVAGAHAARARAAAVHLLQQTRLDAHVTFRDDAAMQRTFGVGEHFSPQSDAEVEAALHGLHQAIESHPAEARKLHLGPHALHTLEDLIAGVAGAASSHRDAKIDRHDDALARASLAHAVTAETAHLRLIANRVFMDDAEHRERYKRTLPRHEVKHRAPKGDGAAAGGAG